MAPTGSDAQGTGATPSGSESSDEQGIGVEPSRQNRQGAGVARDVTSPPLDYVPIRSFFQDRDMHQTAFNLNTYILLFTYEAHRV